MINIKSLISAEIIKKHATYIVKDSGIKEKLDILKNYPNLGLTNEYIKQLCRELGINNENEILESLHDFLGMISSEVLSLETIINKDQIETLKNSANIFIAKPDKLNSRIAEFDSKHNVAFNVMELDSVNRLGKNNFSELINTLLSYDKFILKGSDFLGYRNFLNQLKSPHSEFYKKVKKQTGKHDWDQKYDRKRLSEIKDIINFKVDEFSITEELKEINQNIINEINKVDENGIRKTLQNITEIIKNNYENCICTYESMDLTTQMYAEFYYKPGTPKWNAYHFVLSTGIKSCPYCNRQYITPIYSETSGSVRADLDHFYPKSIYPYFSMSLFNLVPCCKFCNSSLKLDKEFNYNTHLHPYESGFGELLKFRYKPIKYKVTGNSNDEFKIVLETKNESKEEGSTLKAKNNSACFKIESLYNYHRDEVKDLIRKRLIYNDSFSKELRERIEKIQGKPISQQELLQNIVPNILDEQRLHEKTLSKLYRDIVDQLEFFADNNYNTIISEANITALKSLIK